MSDLINRNEALALIETMMETYWDRKQILSIARSNIEKLPAEERVINFGEIANVKSIAMIRNLDWIPTAERLPEKKGWYIISHEQGVVSFDRWLGDDGWDGFTHIKAWMPLPDPYQGGDDE